MMTSHPLVGKKCKWTFPGGAFSIPTFIESGCTVKVMDVYDKPGEEPGFVVAVDGWIGKAFEHELEPLS
jgi:hypothetical protein